MSLVSLRKEGNVGYITMESPENLNAYNVEMARELLGCVYRASGESSIRCLVFSGSGRAFCAGGDVKMMGDSLEIGGDTMRILPAYLHGTITEIRRMEKPVITSVNGIAAGAGIGLALSADLVYLSRDCSFVLAYQQIGLSPDGGASLFLTRELGYHRTMELMLTGRPLIAEEALELGLVNGVFPPEELSDRVKEIATRIAAGPTGAFARGKELFQRAFMENMETQLEMERQGILKQIKTGDFKEGVRAFVEKRDPRFEGK